MSGAVVADRARATPAPRPTASPKPDVTAAPAYAVDASWIPLPLEAQQYASFARPVSGRPADLLTATRRTCDCQPADLVASLEAALKSHDGVTTDTAVTICGEPARHVVGEGIADTIGRRNIDLYVFRAGASLVTLQLGFSTKEPLASDEASLMGLCPPAA